MGVLTKSLNVIINKAIINVESKDAFQVGHYPTLKHVWENETLTGLNSNITGQLYVSRIRSTERKHRNTPQKLADQTRKGLST